ncbi:MAG: GNAT family N-acetyltransferase, partial [Dehalococcoidales bacterium]
VKGTVLVAEDDGSLIGLITLSYPTAIHHGGIYSCIEEFITSPKARGKGVGSQLLEAAIAEANSKGCHEIQVNNPSEAGYPVYLRHEFKDIGKHLRLRSPRRDT